MGPCAWDVLGCDDCAPYMNLTPELRAEVDLWATTRLWEWTNRRFGFCEVTFMSESPECCDLLQHFPCSRNEIVLPGPVAEMIAVTVRGEDVDVCGLHVEDWRYLVRDDGGRFGEQWSATYLRGEPVPAGGSIIAGILACEYAKAMCRDSSCRLPKRLSTITREGLTIGMVDNFSGIREGITGIWEIDDWVMTNATGLRTGPWRASAVFTPDVKRPRQITWVCDS